MGLATAYILGETHHVVICDVNQKALDEAVEKLRAKYITCTAEVCDITDRNSVRETIESAAQHGEIKSMIHTAGVSPQMGKPELITKINAMGTIYVVEEFQRIAPKGAICINVASMAGYLFPKFLIPNRAFKKAMGSYEAFEKGLNSRTNLMPKKSRSGVAYSISKNFVQWYSKKMACSYGKSGLRILSVSPGSFDTNMGRVEKDHGAGKMIDFAAIKRFGKPEEVGELLAFCATDKAGYMTGIDIPIDGGVTACITPKDLKSL